MTPSAPATPPRGLPDLGGDVLAAALDLLCRDECLSRAEIGDHADVLAELADALAGVADRLAHDLDAHDLDAHDLDTAPSAGDDLARARDALQAGSAHSRRGAAALWQRHVALLRAEVERARAASIGPAQW